MIIVDTLLRDRESERRPVVVGITGAGFMTRGMANLLVRKKPGMRLGVIVARQPASALRCYAEAGVDDPVFVDSPERLADALDEGRFAYAVDAEAVTRCPIVDVIIESTGAVDYGAQVAVDAIAHGRHLVMLNAELDAVVGPLLKSRADSAGVVYTGAEGDQPAVQMNLLRFVEGLGCTPVLSGNIKGMLDRYRTPATQAGFARQWDASPVMVTNFADGTKINIEQAVVANATGFGVTRRGMASPFFDGHVDEAMGCFDLEQARERGGVVESIVGARPGPGIFVYATHDDPQQRRFLDYLKMGPGPFYSFYIPYHLCHFEVPNSAARAVLLHDASIAPMGAPVVEVGAFAKRDIVPGERLDGIGGFCAYGLIEERVVALDEGLVPIGLVDGCVATERIAQDEPIRWSAVEPGPRRLVDELYDEQLALWPVSS